MACKVKEASVKKNRFSVVFNDLAIVRKPTANEPKSEPKPAQNPKP